MYHILSKGIKSIQKNGFKLTWFKMKYKLSGKVRMKEYYKNHILSDAEKIKQINTVFDRNIKFSILVPLFNTPENYLKEMIHSVIAQTYGNWELCLADGSDTNHSNVQKICLDLVEIEPRISYLKLQNNLGISENTNSCIEMATGDYMALLDHDDLLLPNALFENAVAIQETNADVLYSDEDHVNEKGDRFSPFFKPDWSPDLLYSQMYICHFLVINKNLVDSIGGFNSEFDGSQDYDFMLRLSEKTKCNRSYTENIIFMERKP